MNYLSSNIKFLRQNNNLTQEQLSKIVKKSRTLVCQWESDDREIRIEDIVTLSDYFNIPMEYLVCRDLRKEEQNNKELKLYFDKNLDILTEGDKEIIKTVINQRKENINRNNMN